MLQSALKKLQGEAERTVVAVELLNEYIRIILEHFFCGESLLNGYDVLTFLISCQL
jgi:hypothetical protein